MRAHGSVPAATLDDADVERWLRLIDRIDATLTAAGGLQAQRLFRALGPRRRADAHRRLVRERQRLVSEIASIGVCPVDGRIAQPSASIDISLDADYHSLAEAFAECAPIAQRLGKVAFKKWLLDRAQMHRQQALFLMM